MTPLAELDGMRLGIRLPRTMAIAFRAWRGITPRQWAWTTGAGLLLNLVMMIGLLPPLLGAAPSLFRTLPVWTTMKSIGATVVGLSTAYCFLLAVSVAEQSSPGRLPPLNRYVAAGVAACVAAIVVEVGLYVLVPEFAVQDGGRVLLESANAFWGRVIWSAANFGLCGGLALAVYVRFRAARLAREAFDAAELERVAARREVLASRLAAMRARIEPEFLLSTLGQVEALYDRDPRSGDRMLDGLITYLRAALPKLRSELSTLQREAALAESYLRIVQMRMGSRLDFAITIDPAHGELDFPPMLLLPLIDEALKRGLEPLLHGGRIVVDAVVAGERLRVRVADDGLSRGAETHEGSVLATLKERLAGLYGESSRFEFLPNEPGGVVAIVEVPLAAARDRR